MYFFVFLKPRAWAILQSYEWKKLVILGSYSAKYNCIPSEHNLQGHLLIQFTKHLQMP